MFCVKSTGILNPRVETSLTKANVCPVWYEVDCILSGQAAICPCICELHIKGKMHYAVEETKVPVKDFKTRENGQK